MGGRWRQDLDYPGSADHSAHGPERSLYLCSDQGVPASYAVPAHGNPDRIRGGRHLRALPRDRPHAAPRPEIHRSALWKTDGEPEPDDGYGTPLGFVHQRGYVDASGPRSKRSQGQPDAAHAKPGSQDGESDEDDASSQAKPASREGDP